MYGAASPKRQWAYSNGRAIRSLDVGWKRMSKARTATAVKYQDGKGVWRYKGTKALRHSEHLVMKSYSLCFTSSPGSTQISLEMPSCDFVMTCSLPVRFPLIPHHCHQDLSS